MTRYSVQTRDWLFVKITDFCLLFEIWEKILAKIWVET